MGPNEEKTQQDSIPAWRKAVEKIEDGPLFRLAYCTRVYCSERYPMAKADWAYSTNDGDIYLNPHRKASVGEWEYIISHCLLHLGFGHFQKERSGHCALPEGQPYRHTAAGVSTRAAFSGQRGRTGIPAITDRLGFWRHFQYHDRRQTRYGVEPR